MDVPFVNLKKEMNTIKNNITDKINNLIFNECSYINGENVKEFETNFAKPFS